MHSDCVTCSHHWSSHRHEERDGWRCQHSTGVMSARVNCDCKSYAPDENAEQTAVTEALMPLQLQAMREAADQVIEVVDSTQPPIFVEGDVYPVLEVNEMAGTLTLGRREATLAKGADV